MTNKNTDNKRWWDFYLVRYFMGTILGSIVFYLIIFKFRYAQGDNLETSLLGAGFNNVLDVALDSGTAIGATILLAGGMLLSYISSGPILILHAIRLGLRFGKIRKRELKFNQTGVVLLILSGAFLGLLVYQLVKISPWVALMNLVVLIPFFLLLYLWCSDRNVPEEQKLDYLCYEIVKKRSAETEYPQTYRHLREHGNAFFIVLTEVLLGGCLYFATCPSDILVILSCWVIPPIFMWFFANYLEGYMMNKKDS